jgi:hypothetical protein
MVCRTLILSWNKYGYCSVPSSPLNGEFHLGRLLLNNVVRLRYSGQTTLLGVVGMQVAPKAQAEYNDRLHKSTTK